MYQVFRALKAKSSDLCSPKVVCLNKDLIGWKPVWNRERLLQSIDQEIDDYLELGMPKSSLLDSLRPKPQVRG